MESILSSVSAFLDFQKTVSLMTLTTGLVPGFVCKLQLLKGNNDVSANAATLFISF